MLKKIAPARSGAVSTAAIAASLLALNLAAPAAAQTSGGVVDQPEAEDAAQGGSVIVVTAQRREEQLEDVPITLTAVGGEQLDNAGIIGSAELGQLVPAFRLDYNGNFAQPSIRGVSTALANVGGGSAVGVYVDGFYNASPLTADFEFLNVESVQVLKGPQGTLFGRNTTAGAVLVTTTEPSFDTELRGQLEYSRFDTVRGNAYFTTPFSELVAFDAGVLYERGDGFFTNLTDGNDEVGEFENLALRFGVMFDFGGDNSILLRYTYADRNDPTPLLWSVYQDPNGRYQTAADAFGIPGAIWGRERGELAFDQGFQPIFTSQTHAVQLTGDFDLGGVNLRTYSQYRHEDSAHDIEVDNSNIPIFQVSFDNRDILYSQEVLLNGQAANDRLDWVVGAFYMNQEAGQTNFSVDVPAIGETYSTNIKVESAAIFADVTWEVVDNLFLTAGARYSHETNSGYWDCFPTGIAVGICPPGQTVTGSWSDFSPRGVIRYALTPNSNIYASVTRGYKSGLVNVNGFQTDTIAPEEIISYEVGYKYGTRTARLEASVFYYDYQNLQVSTYVGTLSITTNAATSEVYGGEISGFIEPIPNLTLSGGIAYTHGRYTDYPTAPANVFDYTVGSTVNPPVDASGNHMIRSPDWSGNVSANYDVDLGGAGTLSFYTNFYFTSEIYFDAANNNRQPGYELWNARVTWRDASERFSVSGFVNNITDTAYRTQVLPNGFGTGVSWGYPTTYGVTLGVDF